MNIGLEKINVFLRSIKPFLKEIKFDEELTFTENKDWQ